MNTNLFLSRAEYDKVLEADNELLSFLVQQLQHRWSLPGIVFYGVSKENQEKIAAILS